MYSYGTVESALALVFRVSEDGIGKLQARVKNYIRIKFTPNQPGKGTNIQYTHENVVQWAIALQLQEFGLEPTQIQKQLAEHWEKIYILSANRDPNSDTLMLFNPALMNDINRYIIFVEIDNFVSLCQNSWRGAICVNVGCLGRDISGAMDKLSEQVSSSRGRGSKRAKAQALGAS